MLQKIKFIIVITLLLNSKVISQTKTSIVDTFFKITKIDLELNQIDQIIDVKIKEKKKEFKFGEKYDKFSKILKNNFNSKKAAIYLKDYFLKGKENSLMDIIKLYERPLLVKINNYEQNFYNPNDRGKQMAFFKKMKTNPPKQERINLLLNLNRHLKSTVRTRNLLEKIIISFSKSYNLITPKEKQLNLTELKTKIKAQLSPDLNKQIKNQFVAFGLYIYKEINDDELKQYIDIWKTDVGKKYIDIIFKAYETVFDKMTNNLITNLNNTF